jgi:Putative transposase/Transposase zinc-binding domain
VIEHRLEVADVFRKYEQEFFAAWGHTLSRQQRRAFRDICACRTAALGAHVQQCDSCSHQSISFNSCRSRNCPKCQSSARDKWLVGQSRHLLPVPYCHVVFTIPHELSPLARQNPKLIYDLLFRAVRETLLIIAADPKRLGAHLGFLAVLHTWNQKMLHHPHLHCLVPAGGLSVDRSRWIRCRGRFFLPKDVLACRFRNRFLKLLAALYRRRQLRLSGKLAELLRPAAFDRLYRCLKKKKWVVYAKRPFGGPEHVLKYLARYTHRIAIANGRLVSLADHEVTFRWRDSADGNTQKLMTVTAVEFIRRFLMHVLPAGFVKIRHFGFLANSNRRAALTLCRSLLARAEPETRPMLSDVQVRAVQRRCPACQTGILHVIGWVAPAETLHLVVRLSVDTS